jgi:hypothetical protein
MSRICHRKLYERAEVRVEIADVEPPLGGPEQHAVHASSRAQQHADRIGQLDFSTGARRRALERGEDLRRQDVSRRNGKRAGSIGGSRLFNEIGKIDQAPGPAVARQDDAVRRRIFPPDLFEGDDGRPGRKAARASIAAAAASVIRMTCPLE